MYANSYNSNISLFRCCNRLLNFLLPIVNNINIPDQFYMRIANGLKKFYAYIVLFIFFEIIICKHCTVGLFFPVINNEFVIDV